MASFAEAVWVATVEAVKSIQVILTVVKSSETRSAVQLAAVDHFIRRQLTKPAGADWFAINLFHTDRFNGIAFE